jgi:hypothetical protein
LKDHSEDKGVQEEGYEALIHLVLNSDEEEGMRRVCAAGGVEAVMQAVKTHGAYSNVGTSAIYFFYKIRDGCDDTRAKCPQAMGRVRMPERVGALQTAVAATVGAYELNPKP